MMKKFLASMMIAVSAFSLLPKRPPVRWAAAAPSAASRKTCARCARRDRRRNRRRARPLPTPAPAPMAPAAIPQRSLACGRASWAARCWAWAWARCSRTSASAAPWPARCRSILMILLLAVRRDVHRAHVPPQIHPAVASFRASTRAPLAARRKSVPCLNQGWQPNAEKGSRLHRPNSTCAEQAPARHTSNGACRPTSTPRPSCAMRKRPSSACRPPGTAATWPTCASSPRRKCSPNCKCRSRSAAARPTTPTSSDRRPAAGHRNHRARIPGQRAVQRHDPQAGGRPGRAVSTKCGTCPSRCPAMAAGCWLVFNSFLQYFCHHRADMCPANW
jgi:hypothetical protein